MQTLKLIRTICFIFCFIVINCAELDSTGGGSPYITDCFRCILNGEECDPKCTVCWDLDCQEGSTFRCFGSVVKVSINQFIGTESSRCRTSTTTTTTSEPISSTESFQYDPPELTQRTDSNENTNAVSKFMNSSTLFFLLLTVSILVWSKVAVAYLLCARPVHSRDSRQSITSNPQQSEGLRTPLPINEV